MLRHITLAVVALLLAAPAHAATKSAVAAAGCNTLEQARKAHQSDHLRYRLIGGSKCWYSDSAMAKKASTKVAAKPVAIVKKVEVRAPEELLLEDAIDREFRATFELLCGGPCPQLRGELRDQWPRRVDD